MPTSSADNTTLEKQRKKRETAAQKKATKQTEKTLETEIRTALDCIDNYSSDSDISDGTPVTPVVQSNRHPMVVQQQFYREEPMYTPLTYPPSRQALQQQTFIHPYLPQASESTWPQHPPSDLGLTTQIEKLTLLVENLTRRIEALEKAKTSPTDSKLFLGESLSLTAGQQATLKCLASSQDWPYTLRKLLSIVFQDIELARMCAVGKPGAKNTAMNKEDLGALKGIHVCICVYMHKSLLVKL